MFCSDLTYIISYIWTGTQENDTEMYNFFVHLIGPPGPGGIKGEKGYAGQTGQPGKPVSERPTVH